MAPAKESRFNYNPGQRTFSIMTFDFETSPPFHDDDDVICACELGGRHGPVNGSNSYQMMPLSNKGANENFSESSTPSTVATPADGNSLVSPEAINGDRPSIAHPFMNRFRMLAIALLSFANGLSDGAVGALIPSIEKHYSIGYMVVSLLFVAQALGYIIAAAVTDPVRERFGRAKTLCISQCILAIGFAPLPLRAPYPLVVLSFFVIGICKAFNVAIGNVFCGSLSNGTTALGIMHAAYGIGGAVGPLIATSLLGVSRTTSLLTFPRFVWGVYYCIPYFLAAINCSLSGWSFSKYEQEVGEKESGDTESGEAGPNNTRATATILYELFSPVSSKVVLLGSLFLFAYQGAEVSISGWFISFLIDTRHGDPHKVGYATTGFWAGITLGRLFLPTAAQRVGEKPFVYAVSVVAAMFQVVAWLVPNIVGDAIMVSFLGFLLGPIYPCAVAVFMRAMDKHEQVRGMVIMAAVGSAGGAVAPFTTGLIAQAVGTYVLNPIAIGLYGVMLVCWFFCPNKPQNMG